MEYFDVVDKDRKPLGKKYLRGTKLDTNEFNTGVEVYITYNNKLLVSERCEEKSHPLMWEAQGGCVIAGDNSLDTVYRELEEEIGLKLDKEVKFLTTCMYKQQFVDVYTVELDQDYDFTLQKEEVKDIKWVTKSEFEEMIDNNLVVPSVVDRYNVVKDMINLK